jgi:hypothetical protein
MGSETSVTTSIVPSLWFRYIYLNNLAVHKNLWAISVIEEVGGQSVSLLS